VRYQTGTCDAVQSGSPSSTWIVQKNFMSEIKVCRNFHNLVNFSLLIYVTAGGGGGGDDATNKQAKGSKRRKVIQKTRNHAQLDAKIEANPLQ
jgi:hypothetical protein